MPILMYNACLLRQIFELRHSPSSGKKIYDRKDGRSVKYITSFWYFIESNNLVGATNERTNERTNNTEKRKSYQIRIDRV